MFSRPFDWHIKKTETCWIWTNRFRGKSEYGLWWNKGKIHRAHRVAWEKVNGPILGDMILHHKCGVKRCVNPDHLELTTRQVHEDAGPMTHKRKTHCKRGHEFTKENTEYTNRALGYRRCIACNKLREKGRI